MVLKHLVVVMTLLAGLALAPAAPAGGAFVGGAHRWPAGHPGGFPAPLQPPRGVFFGVDGFHPGAFRVLPRRRVGSADYRLAPYPVDYAYGGCYRASRHGWRPWYSYTDFSKINYAGVAPLRGPGPRDYGTR